MQFEQQQPTVPAREEAEPEPTEQVRMQTEEISTRIRREVPSASPAAGDEPGDEEGGSPELAGDQDPEARERPDLNGGPRDDSDEDAEDGGAEGSASSEAASRERARELEPSPGGRSTQLERPRAARPAEQRAPDDGEHVQAAWRRTGASRDPGADLVLDSPQLKVDELSLEVNAKVGVEHLRLDAKNLDADLFLQANLHNLVALVESTTQAAPDIITAARDRVGKRGRPGRGDGSSDLDGGRSSLLRRAATPAGAALAGLAAGSVARDGGKGLGRLLPGASGPLRKIVRKLG